MEILSNHHIKSVWWNSSVISTIIFQLYFHLYATKFALNDASHTYNEFII